MLDNKIIKVGVSSIVGAVAGYGIARVWAMSTKNSLLSVTTGFVAAPVVGKIINVWNSTTVDECNDEKIVNSSDLKNIDSLQNNQSETSM